MTVLWPIVVYARGSRHEFSRAMSDTYVWERFSRSHGYLRMSKGLYFLVGSDAAVPMQCLVVLANRELSTAVPTLRHVG